MTYNLFGTLILLQVTMKLKQNDFAQKSLAWKKLSIGNLTMIIHTISLPLLKDPIIAKPDSECNKITDYLSCAFSDEHHYSLS